MRWSQFEMSENSRMAIAVVTQERIGSHRWWVKSVGGVKGIWDSGYYIEEPPLWQQPLAGRGGRSAHSH